MSYAVHLAGDAIADLQALDPWVQEEVIDELERVAAQPRQLHPDDDGNSIHDFERLVGGVRHVLFLRLHRDDVRQLLSVVAMVDRPRPPRSIA